MGCCDSKSNQIEPEVDGSSSSSGSNNQTVNNNQQHSSTLSTLKEEEEQEQKQDTIIIDNSVVEPSTSGTNKVIEEMTNKSLNESINETKSEQLKDINNNNNNEISKSVEVIDQEKDENIINDKLDARPKSVPITNVAPSMNQIENNQNSLITND
jgi:hypothetical protein